MQSSLRVKTTYVILSCVTLEQLASAANYARLALKQSDDAEITKRYYDSVLSWRRTTILQGVSHAKA